MKSLLLYSSYDGQSKRIMAAVAEEMVQAGIECEPVDLHSLTTDIDPSDYDSVLIGASIRYGFFSDKMKSYVQKHSEKLNNMTSAFFSVTLIARKLEKRTPETNGYTRKFLASTPWKPKDCGVFAGALHYPKYRWIDRVMIQLIMKMTGGETDASKDVEFTDWQQVREFGQRFSALTKATIKA